MDDRTVQWQTTFGVRSAAVNEEFEKWLNLFRMPKDIKYDPITNDLLKAAWLACAELLTAKHAAELRAPAKPKEKPDAR